MAEAKRNFDADTHPYVRALIHQRHQAQHGKRGLTVSRGVFRSKVIPKFGRIRCA